MTLVSIVRPETQAQDRARDTAATGSLGGSVVAADTGRPLAYASVSLRRGGREVAVTSTDSRGVYQFDALAGGSYAVSAVAPRYLRSDYTGRADGGAAWSIQLGERQSVQRIDLRLPRGGVIAGTITNRSGDPLTGVRISVVPLTEGATATRPSVVVITNDRGEFRAWGLDAARYRLAVGPLWLPVDGTDVGTFVLSPGKDLTGLTFALPDAVVAGATTVNDSGVIVSGTILEDGGDPAVAVRVSLRPRGDRLTERRPIYTTLTDDRGEFRIVGVPPDQYVLAAAPVDAPTGALNGSQPPERWVNTYYPGGTSPAGAQLLSVSSDAIEGLSVTLQRTRAVSLTGRVIVPGADRIRGGVAALVSEADRGDGEQQAAYYAGITAEGRFAFERIPPGTYAVEAMTTGERETSYGQLATSVTDGSAPDLVIGVQSLSGVSGRIVWNGARPPAAVSAQLRITAPRLRETLALRATFAQIAPDGTFRIANVLPGRHILRAEHVPDGWQLQSVANGDQRLDGVEFDMPPVGSLDDLRLSFAATTPAERP